MMPRGKVKVRVWSKAQIRAVLTSELDEGAKVLWVFLATCAPGGAGRARLSDLLSLIDFDDALAVLIDRGLAKRQSGKVLPLPMLLDEGETPTPENASLRASSEELFQIYNSARAEAGAVRLAFDLVTDRTWAKLDDLVEFLTAHQIGFRVWVDFAAERSAWQKEVGMVFPDLNNLAGPHLRQVWFSTKAAPAGGSSRRSEPTPGHAGRTYENPLWLRTFLVEQRIRGARALTDAELRHIYTSARNFRAAPGKVEIDEGFEDEIRAVISHMEKEDARSS